MELGKTTTLKSILNLITRDKGEIKIFGLDIKQNEKKIGEAMSEIVEFT